MSDDTDWPEFCPNCGGLLLEQFQWEDPGEQLVVMQHCDDGCDFKQTRDFVPDDTSDEEQDPEFRADAVTG